MTTYTITFNTATEINGLSNGQPISNFWKTGEAFCNAQIISQNCDVITILDQGEVYQINVADVVISENVPNPVEAPIVYTAEGTTVYGTRMVNNVEKVVFGEACNTRKAASKLAREMNA